jgi:hypothetical protein
MVESNAGQRRAHGLHDLVEGVEGAQRLRLCQGARDGLTPRNQPIAIHATIGSMIA